MESFRKIKKFILSILNYLFIYLILLYLTFFCLINYWPAAKIYFWPVNTYLYAAVLVAFFLFFFSRKNNFENEQTKKNKLICAMISFFSLFYIILHLKDFSLTISIVIALLGALLICNLFVQLKE